MIRKYRFGKPFETDAVVVKQPDAAVFGPDSTPAVPYFTVKKVDANAQTDLSVGRFGPSAAKPVKDAWQFILDLRKGDIVYGLGEAQRGINKRGWLYISDNVDDNTHTETKYNLYGAHNFLIVDREDGQGNFGIFLDDPGIVRFDVGYTDMNKLIITASGLDFDLYFFSGRSESGKPYAITREFRGIIGHSYIPPKWGFGYGQSRYGYENEADIRAVWAGHRDNGIPLDAIYLDIDYMVGYKDFTVDTKAFPDLPALSAELKADGVRLVPIIDAGIKVLELSVEGGEVRSVRVDMGEPRVRCEEVPCLLGTGVVRRAPVTVLGRTFEVTPVCTGNPHGVILLDEPVEGFDLAKYGPALEAHPVFPQKANIEFVNVLSQDRLRMRVWERGSGITLACGTGSCAALVAAHINGVCGRRATVVLDGGELVDEWDEATGHVFMTGPAAFVFDGEYDVHR